MTERTMDDPIQRFEEEHRHALRVLDELEAAVVGVEHEEGIPRNLVRIREAHRFLSTAVREHNENEERALFPLLGDEAPTGIFEEEHVELRTLEGELAAALDSPDPAARVGAPGHAIIGLLRAHIEREDQVLFPMARTLLGKAGLSRVGALLE
jgi:hemerythrin-like domain-containing protein